MASLHRMGLEGGGQEGLELGDAHSWCCLGLWWMKENAGDAGPVIPFTHAPPPCPKWAWLQSEHSAQGTPCHPFSSSQKQWGSLSRGMSGVWVVQSSTQVSGDTRICLQASWLSLSFGGVVSPRPCRHHSPVLSPSQTTLLPSEGEQRSALCISWQTHAITGRTGLKMPGGGCGLVQACFRTASRRE